MKKLEYKHTREKVLIFVFCSIVILSQGIRTKLGNVIGINFNYLIIPMICVFFMVIRYSKKINIMHLLIILSIIFLNVISFTVYRYDKATLIRGIITFIFPLCIMILDYKNIDKKYFINKIIKIYNVFIIFSFIYVVISVLIKSLEIPTGGIIGHSLTAGWYYTIFIALNCSYCKYIKNKKDIFILKDILIFLGGTILTSGRIAIFLGALLSIVYALSCCKSKMVKYITIPILFCAFISSSMFNNIILEKFRFAAGYGDITNGRLLGIREMKFIELYPKFWTGEGIGYSNYVTYYLLGTINFENPILMFAFDYGILSVILILISTFIIPCYKFIRNKKNILVINFIGIYLIPYTYNGIAESTGLFGVLIIIVLVFLIINEV